MLSAMAFRFYSLRLLLGVLVRLYRFRLWVFVGVSGEWSIAYWIHQQCDCKLPRIPCAMENFAHWCNWRRPHGELQPQIDDCQRDSLVAFPPPGHPQIDDCQHDPVVAFPGHPGQHFTGFEISRRVLPPTSLGRGVQWGKLVV